ncbi:MAG: glycosyltransferase family 39 protein [Acidobacteriota bacterium]
MSHQRAGSGRRQVSTVHTRVLGFRITSYRLAIVAAFVLICLLYLGNLAGMGLILPDEPRYADIGRAMAKSGDWITPRLWGSPWFEKPVLLYWLIGAGFKLGWGPEIAPRLPVALLGLGFLAFFWLRLRRLWNPAVAGYSTALLATSAGWLAYSHVAITDIPMAVFFSAALLLSLEEENTNYTAIAALLGLATLAKSLPPLVLFLPVVLLDYRRFRAWFRPGPVLAFAAVSLPWHILCTLRNGLEFPRVLFVEQQLGRFTSGALQHIQPWWFYIPVLPLLLYPWFPLLVVASRDWRDRRVRLLYGVVLFGFVFLSAGVNKLPSYLLPLLPALCILMGAGIPRSSRGQRLVVVSVGLLALLPPAAGVLPAALSTGIRSILVPWTALAGWLAAGLLTGVVLFFSTRKNALFAAAGLAAICYLWFQTAVFPRIDSVVSARALWNATHPRCAPALRRTVLYSLYYYAGRELAPCDSLDQAATPVVR